MAKINVILQAQGRDRGARKLLRDLTKLSDGLTESADKAAAAGKRVGFGGLAGPSGGGRGGRGSRGPGADRGTGDRPSRGRSPESKRAALERDFNRALSDSVTDARKQARAMDRQARQQAKVARNIENLSDAQLEEIATQNTINRRRRRAAQTAAETKLGPDPTARGGRRGRGGRGRLEFAENLSVAGGEFEQFGANVEQGIRGSFDAFKDYEKGITEVSTLTNEIQVDKIREITSGAAAQFGGLPTEQVSAFYAIVSAGATNAADAQAQLTAANKLAIGGVASSEEAVLAISKSVANFGDQGVDAAQASDSLFTAVKRGQTTVAEMSRALPQVAQAASDAGLTLDETNAAIAVLSTRFASAKEGSTALRQALSNIAKPTKGAREEAKRLGIDFSNAGIEAAGGIEEFLLKLRAAEKFDENTLAKLFDSTEARAAVSGLVSGMDDYRAVLSDMENKQGAADTAFQKMSETSAQKAKQLEAQWELLKIQAGESLVPALTDLAGEIGPIIKDVTDWIKDNPKLATTLGKVAIGTAVAARGIGVLTSAISGFNTIIGLGEVALDKFGVSAKSAGKAAKGTGKEVGGMGKAGAGLAGPLAVGAVALIGFEAAMSQAEEATNREQKRLDELHKTGLKVEFQTPEGAEKSEEQLLADRRQRLIDDLNAKQEQQRLNSAQLAREQIGRGSFGSALGTTAGGIVNMVSGVDEEQARQSRQARLDLARFDEQYGQQLGLKEDEQFTESQGLFGRGSGVDDLVKLLEKQVELTSKVASNTTGQPWEGPSMDAGMG